MKYTILDNNQNPLKTIESSLPYEQILKQYAFPIGHRAVKVKNYENKENKDEN